MTEQHQNPEKVPGHNIPEGIRKVKEENKMHLARVNPLIELLKKEMEKFKQVLESSREKIPGEGNELGKSVDGAEKAIKKLDAAEEAGKKAEEEIDKIEEKEKKDRSHDEETIEKELEKLVKSFERTRHELEEIKAVDDEEFRDIKKLHDLLVPIREGLLYASKLPEDKCIEALKKMNTIHRGIYSLRKEFSKSHNAMKGALWTIYRFSRLEYRHYNTLGKDVRKFINRPDVDPGAKQYLERMLEQLERPIQVIIAYERELTGKEKEAVHSEEEIMKYMDSMKKKVEEIFKGLTSPNPKKETLEKRITANKQHVLELIAIIKRLDDAAIAFRRLLVTNFETTRNFYSAVNQLIQVLSQKERALKSIEVSRKTAARA